jgi:hypothetical protein
MNLVQKSAHGPQCLHHHPTTEEYSIPTSNTFDPLTDDVANQGDNTNEHVELKSKGNKEENVEDGVEQNASKCTTRN